MAECSSETGEAMAMNLLFFISRSKVARSASVVYGSGEEAPEEDDDDIARALIPPPQTQPQPLGDGKCEWKKLIGDLEAECWRREERTRRGGIRIAAI